MKSLIFVFTFLSATSCFAAESLAGFLIKEYGKIYLSSRTTCGRYEVVSSSADVTNNLRKLTHGDAVIATADVYTDLCQVRLQSIDYVGLRRLLGVWQSDAGLIEIRDFSSLKIYPRFDNISREGSLEFEVPMPVTYQYSVLPSPGKEWVVFLSDSKTTTFATLTLEVSTAILRTFDSDSGAMTQELHMVRWKSTK
jgi:hypothetical protein